MFPHLTTLEFPMLKLIISLFDHTDRTAATIGFALFLIAYVNALRTDALWLNLDAILMIIVGGATAAAAGVALNQLRKSIVA